MDRMKTRHDYAGPVLSRRQCLRINSGVRIRCSVYNLHAEGDNESGRARKWVSRDLVRSISHAHG